MAVINTDYFKLMPQYKKDFYQAILRVAIWAIAVTLSVAMLVALNVGMKFAKNAIRSATSVVHALRAATAGQIIANMVLACMLVISVIFLCRKLWGLHSTYDIYKISMAKFEHDKRCIVQDSLCNPSQSTPEFVRKVCESDPKLKNSYISVIDENGVAKTACDALKILQSSDFIDGEYRVLSDNIIKKPKFSLDVKRQEKLKKEAERKAKRLGVEVDVSHINDMIEEDANAIKFISFSDGALSVPLMVQVLYPYCNLPKIQDMKMIQDVSIDTQLYKDNNFLQSGDDPQFTIEKRANIIMDLMKVTPYECWDSVSRVLIRSFAKLFLFAYTKPNYKSEVDKNCFTDLIYGVETNVVLAIAMLEEIIVFLPNVNSKSCEGYESVKSLIVSIFNGVESVFNGNEDIKDKHKVAYNNIRYELEEKIKERVVGYIDQHHYGNEDVISNDSVIDEGDVIFLEAMKISSSLDNSVIASKISSLLSLSISATHRLTPIVFAELISPLGKLEELSRSEDPFLLQPIVSLISKTFCDYEGIIDKDFNILYAKLDKIMSNVFSPTVISIIFDPVNASFFSADARRSLIKFIPKYCECVRDSNPSLLDGVALSMAKCHMDKEDIECILTIDSQEWDNVENMPGIKEKFLKSMNELYLSVGVAGKPIMPDNLILTMPLCVKLYSEDNRIERDSKKDNDMRYYSHYLKHVLSDAKTIPNSTKEQQIDIVKSAMVVSHLAESVNIDLQDDFRYCIKKYLYGFSDDTWIDIISYLYGLTVNIALGKQNILTNASRGLEGGVEGGVHSALVKNNAIGEYKKSYRYLISSIFSMLLGVSDDVVNIGSDAKKGKEILQCALYGMLYSAYCEYSLKISNEVTNEHIKLDDFIAESLSEVILNDIYVSLLKGDGGSDIFDRILNVLIMVNDIRSSICKQAINSVLRDLFSSPRFDNLFEKNRNANKCVGVFVRAVLGILKFQTITSKMVDMDVQGNFWSSSLVNSESSAFIRGELLKENHDYVDIALRLVKQDSFAANAVKSVNETDSNDELQICHEQIRKDKLGEFWKISFADNKCTLVMHAIAHLMDIKYAYPSCYELSSYVDVSNQPKFDEIRLLHRGDSGVISPVIRVKRVIDLLSSTLVWNDGSDKSVKIVESIFTVINDQFRTMLEDMYENIRGNKKVGLFHMISFDILGALILNISKMIKGTDLSSLSEEREYLFGCLNSLKDKMLECAGNRNVALPQMKIVLLFDEFDNAIEDLLVGDSGATSSVSDLVASRIDAVDTNDLVKGEAANYIDLVLQSIFTNHTNCLNVLSNVMTSEPLHRKDFKLIIKHICESRLMSSIKSSGLSVNVKGCIGKLDGDPVSVGLDICLLSFAFRHKISYVMDCISGKRGVVIGDDAIALLRSNLTEFVNELFEAGKGLDVFKTMSIDDLLPLFCNIKIDELSNDIKNKLSVFLKSEYNPGKSNNSVLGHLIKRCVARNGVIDKGLESLLDNVKLINQENYDYGNISDSSWKKVDSKKVDLLSIFPRIVTNNIKDLVSGLDMVSGLNRDGVGFDSNSFVNGNLNNFGNIAVKLVEDLTDSLDSISCIEDELCSNPSVIMAMYFLNENDGESYNKIASKMILIRDLKFSECEFIRTLGSQSRSVDEIGTSTMLFFNGILLSNLLKLYLENKEKENDNNIKWVLDTLSNMLSACPNWKDVFQFVVTNLMSQCLAKGSVMKSMTGLFDMLMAIDNDDNWDDRKDFIKFVFQNATLYVNDSASDKELRSSVLSSEILKLCLYSTNKRQRDIAIELLDDMAIDCAGGKFKHILSRGAQYILPELFNENCSLALDKKLSLFNSMIVYHVDLFKVEKNNTNIMEKLSHHFLSSVWAGVNNLFLSKGSSLDLIVPTEFTKKQGGDFDVAKMFMDPQLAMTDFVITKLNNDSDLLVESLQSIDTSYVFKLLNNLLMGNGIDYNCLEQSDINNYRKNLSDLIGMLFDKSLLFYSKKKSNAEKRRLAIHDVLIGIISRGQSGLQESDMDDVSYRDGIPNILNRLIKAIGSTNVENVFHINRTDMDSAIFYPSANISLAKNLDYFSQLRSLSNKSNRSSDEEENLLDLFLKITPSFYSVIMIQAYRNKKNLDKDNNLEAVEYFQRLIIDSDTVKIDVLKNILKHNTSVFIFAGETILSEIYPNWKELIFNISNDDGFTFDEKVKYLLNIKFIYPDMKFPINGREMSINELVNGDRSSMPDAFSKPLLMDVVELFHSSILAKEGKSVDISALTSILEKALNYINKISSGEIGNKGDIKDIAYACRKIFALSIQILDNGFTPLNKGVSSKVFRCNDKDVCLSEFILDYLKKNDSDLFDLKKRKSATPRKHQKVLSKPISRAADTLISSLFGAFVDNSKTCFTYSHATTFCPQGVIQYELCDESISKLISSLIKDDDVENSFYMSNTVVGAIDRVVISPNIPISASMDSKKLAQKSKLIGDIASHNTAKNMMFCEDIAQLYIKGVDKGVENGGFVNLFGHVCSNILDCNVDAVKKMVDIPQGVDLLKGMVDFQSKSSMQKWIDFSDDKSFVKNRKGNYVKLKNGEFVKTISKYLGSSDNSFNPEAHKLGIQSVKVPDVLYEFTGNEDTKTVSSRRVTSFSMDVDVNKKNVMQSQVQCTMQQDIDLSLALNTDVNVMQNMSTDSKADLHTQAQVFAHILLRIYSENSRFQSQKLPNQFAFLGENFVSIRDIRDQAIAGAIAYIFSDQSKKEVISMGKAPVSAITIAALDAILAQVHNLPDASVIKNSPSAFISCLLAEVPGIFIHNGRIDFKSPQSKELGNHSAKLWGVSKIRDVDAKELHYSDSDYEQLRHVIKLHLGENFSKEIDKKYPFLFNPMSAYRISVNTAHMLKELILNGAHRFNQSRMQSIFQYALTRLSHIALDVPKGYVAPDNKAHDVTMDNNIFDSFIGATQSIPRWMPSKYMSVVTKNDLIINDLSRFVDSDLSIFLDESIACKAGSRLLESLQCFIKKEVITSLQHRLDNKSPTKKIGNVYELFSSSILGNIILSDPTVDSKKLANISIDDLQSLINMGKDVSEDEVISGNRIYITQDQLIVLLQNKFRIGGNIDIPDGEVKFALDNDGSVQKDMIQAPNMKYSNMIKRASDKIVLQAVLEFVSQYGKARHTIIDEEVKKMNDGSRHAFVGFSDDKKRAMADAMITISKCSAQQYMRKEGLFADMVEQENIYGNRATNDLLVSLDDSMMNTIAQMINSKISLTMLEHEFRAIRAQMIMDSIVELFSLNSNITSKLILPDSRIINSSDVLSCYGHGLFDALCAFPQRGVFVIHAKICNIIDKVKSNNLRVESDEFAKNILELHNLFLSFSAASKRAVSEKQEVAMDMLCIEANFLHWRDREEEMIDSLKKSDGAVDKSTAYRRAEEKIAQGCAREDVIFPKEFKNELGERSDILRNLDLLTHEIDPSNTDSSSMASCMKDGMDQMAILLRKKSEAPASLSVHLSQSGIRQAYMSSHISLTREQDKYIESFFLDTSDFMTSFSLRCTNIDRRLAMFGDSKGNYTQSVAKSAEFADGSVQADFIGKLKDIMQAKVPMIVKFTDDFFHTIMEKDQSNFIRAFLCCNSNDKSALIMKNYVSSILKKKKSELEAQIALKTANESDLQNEFNSLGGVLARGNIDEMSALAGVDLKSSVAIAVSKYIVNKDDLYFGLDPSNQKSDDNLLLLAKEKVHVLSPLMIEAIKNAIMTTPDDEMYKVKNVIETLHEMIVKGMHIEKFDYKKNEGYIDLGPNNNCLAFVLLEHIEYSIFPKSRLASSRSFSSRNLMSLFDDIEVYRAIDMILDGNSRLIPDVMSTWVKIFNAAKAFGDVDIKKLLLSFSTLLSFVKNIDGMTFADIPNFEDIVDQIRVQGPSILSQYAYVVKTFNFRPLDQLLLLSRIPLQGRQLSTLNLEKKIPTPMIHVLAEREIYNVICDEMLLSSLDNSGVHRIGREDLVRCFRGSIIEGTVFAKSADAIKVMEDSRAIDIIDNLKKSSSWDIMHNISIMTPEAFKYLRHCDDLPMAIMVHRAVILRDMARGKSTPLSPFVSLYEYIFKDLIGCIKKNRKVINAGNTSRSNNNSDNYDSMITSSIGFTEKDDAISLQDRCNIIHVIYCACSRSSGVLSAESLRDYNKLTDDLKDIYNKFMMFPPRYLSKFITSLIEKHVFNSSADLKFDFTFLKKLVSFELSKNYAINGMPYIWDQAVSINSLQDALRERYPFYNKSSQNFKDVDIRCSKEWKSLCSLINSIINITQRDEGYIILENIINYLEDMNDVVPEVYALIFASCCNSRNEIDREKVRYIATTISKGQPLSYLLKLYDKHKNRRDVFTLDYLYDVCMFPICDLLDTNRAIDVKSLENLSAFHNEDMRLRTDILMYSRDLNPDLVQEKFDLTQQKIEQVNDEMVDLRAVKLALMDNKDILNRGFSRDKLLHWTNQARNRKDEKLPSKNIWKSKVQYGEDEADINKVNKVLGESNAKLTGLVDLLNQMKQLDNDIALVTSESYRLKQEALECRRERAAITLSSFLSEAVLSPLKISIKNYINSEVLAKINKDVSNASASVASKFSNQLDRAHFANPNHLLSRMKQIDIDIERLKDMLQALKQKDDKDILKLKEAFRISSIIKGKCISRDLLTLTYIKLKEEDKFYKKAFTHERLNAFVESAGLLFSAGQNSLGEGEDTSFGKLILFMITAITGIDIGQNQLSNIMKTVSDSVISVDCLGEHMKGSALAHVYAKALADSARGITSTINTALDGGSGDNLSSESKDIMRKMMASFIATSLLIKTSLNEKHHKALKESMNQDTMIIRESMAKSITTNDVTSIFDGIGLVVANGTSPDLARINGKVLKHITMLLALFIDPACIESFLCNIVLNKELYKNDEKEHAKIKRAASHVKEGLSILLDSFCTIPEASRERFQKEVDRLQSSQKRSESDERFLALYKDALAMPKTSSPEDISKVASWRSDGLHNIAGRAFNNAMREAVSPKKLLDKIVNDKTRLLLSIMLSKGKDSFLENVIVLPDKTDLKIAEETDKFLQELPDVYAVIERASVPIRKAIKELSDPEFSDVQDNYLTALNDSYLDGMRKSEEKSQSLIDLEEKKSVLQRNIDAYCVKLEANKDFTDTQGRLLYALESYDDYSTNLKNHQVSCEKSRNKLSAMVDVATEYCEVMKNETDSKKEKVFAANGDIVSIQPFSKTMKIKNVGDEFTKSVNQGAAFRQLSAMDRTMDRSNASYTTLDGEDKFYKNDMGTSLYKVSNMFSSVDNVAASVVETFIAKSLFTLSQYLMASEERVIREFIDKFGAFFRLDDRWDVRATVSAKRSEISKEMRKNIIIKCIKKNGLGSDASREYKAVTNNSVVACNDLESINVRSFITRVVTNNNSYDTFSTELNENIFDKDNAILLRNLVTLISSNDITQSNWNALVDGARTFVSPQNILSELQSGNYESFKDRVKVVHPFFEAVFQHDFLRDILEKYNDDEIKKEIDLVSGKLHGNIVISGILGGNTIKKTLYDASEMTSDLCYLGVNFYSIAIALEQKTLLYFQDSKKISTYSELSRKFFDMSARVQRILSFSSDKDISYSKFLKEVYELIEGAFDVFYNNIITCNLGVEEKKDITDIRSDFILFVNDLELQKEKKDRLRDFTLNKDKIKRMNTLIEDMNKIREKACNDSLKQELFPEYKDANTKDSISGDDLDIKKNHKGFEDHYKASQFIGLNNTTFMLQRHYVDQLKVNLDKSIKADNSLSENEKQDVTISMQQSLPYVREACQPNRLHLSESSYNGFNTPLSIRLSNNNYVKEFNDLLNKTKTVPLLSSEEYADIMVSAKQFKQVKERFDESTTKIKSCIDSKILEINSSLFNREFTEDVKKKVCGFIDDISNEIASLLKLFNDFEKDILSLNKSLYDDRRLNNKILQSTFFDIEKLKSSYIDSKKDIKEIIRNNKLKVDRIKVLVEGLSRDDADTSKIKLESKKELLKSLTDDVINPCNSLCNSMIDISRSPVDLSKEVIEKNLLEENISEDDKKLIKDYYNQMALLIDHLDLNSDSKFDNMMRRLNSDKDKDDCKLELLKVAHDNSINPGLIELVLSLKMLEISLKRDVLSGQNIPFDFASQMLYRLLQSLPYLKFIEERKLQCKNNGVYNLFEDQDVMNGNFSTLFKVATGEGKSRLKCLTAIKLALRSKLFDNKRKVVLIAHSKAQAKSLAEDLRLLVGSQKGCAMYHLDMSDPNLAQKVTEKDTTTVDVTSNGVKSVVQISLNNIKNHDIIVTSSEDMVLLHMISIMKISKDPFKDPDSFLYALGDKPSAVIDEVDSILYKSDENRDIVLSANLKSDSVSVQRDMIDLFIRFITSDCVREFSISKQYLKLDVKDKLRFLMATLICINTLTQNKNLKTKLSPNIMILRHLLSKGDSLTDDDLQQHPIIASLVTKYLIPFLKSSRIINGSDFILFPSQDGSGRVINIMDKETCTRQPFESYVGGVMEALTAKEKYDPANYNPEDILLMGGRDMVGMGIVMRPETVSMQDTSNSSFIDIAFGEKDGVSGTVGNVVVTTDLAEKLGAKIAYELPRRKDFDRSEKRDMVIHENDDQVYEQIAKDAIDIMIKSCGKVRPIIKLMDVKSVNIVKEKIDKLQRSIEQDYYGMKINVYTMTDTEGGVVRADGVVDKSMADPNNTVKYTQSLMEYIKNDNSAGQGTILIVSDLFNRAMDIKNPANGDFSFHMLMYPFSHFKKGLVDIEKIEQTEGRVGRNGKEEDEITIYLNREKHEELINHLIEKDIIDSETLNLVDGVTKKNAYDEYIKEVKRLSLSGSLESLERCAKHKEIGRQGHLLNSRLLAAGESIYNKLNELCKNNNTLKLLKRNNYSIWADDIKDIPTDSIPVANYNIQNHLGKDNLNLILETAIAINENTSDTQGNSSYKIKSNIKSKGHNICNYDYSEENSSLISTKIYQNKSSLIQKMQDKNLRDMDCINSIRAFSAVKKRDGEELLFLSDSVIMGDLLNYLANITLNVSNNSTISVNTVNIAKAMLSTSDSIKAIKGMEKFSKYVDIKNAMSVMMCGLVTCFLKSDAHISDTINAMLYPSGERSDHGRDFCISKVVMVFKVMEDIDKYIKGYLQAKLAHQLVSGQAGDTDKITKHTILFEKQSELSKYLQQTIGCNSEAVTGIFQILDAFLDKSKFQTVTEIDNCIYEKDFSFDRSQEDTMGCHILKQCSNRLMATEETRLIDTISVMRREEEIEDISKNTDEKSKELLSDIKKENEKEKKSMESLIKIHQLQISDIKEDYRIKENPARSAMTKVYTENWDQCSDLTSQVLDR